MQQFARRKPSESEGGQPQGSNPITASDDMIAQWLDQLCETGKQLSELKEEVAVIKGENQRLRLQIAGWMSNQESNLAHASVPPAVEPEQPASVAEVEAVSPQENIDEEDLIELVRGSGVPEVEAHVPVQETVTATEAPAEPTQLSDDEIQRLLEEAANGANETSETIAEPVTSVPEFTEPTEDDATPFLKLEEEAVELQVQPFVPSFEIDPSAAKRVPSHLAIAALAVPVRLEDGKVVCKAAAPFDHASLDLIADAIAGQVIPEAAPIEEILAALRKVYGEESHQTEKDEVWSVSNAPDHTKPGLLGRLFRRSA